ncbi:Protein of unknown function [Pyronema omphalodes CBS 100304]|uniref:Uncharacterized protein n=1 Tax=Pyronema omphalodes (strain CBS 100304) TaxID=1076935 RepID=U4LA34_PYROM|nr:Protein of unknown function [Pyronema omphalodes CBS 100304]
MFVSWSDTCAGQMEDPNFELGKPNGDHQYNHSLKSPVFGRLYLPYLQFRISVILIWKA